VLKFNYNSIKFTKIKGAKIILHVKSPTFMPAKLKGFAVSRHYQPQLRLASDKTLIDQVTELKRFYAPLVTK